VEEKQWEGEGWEGSRQQRQRGSFPTILIPNRALLLPLSRPRPTTR